MAMKPLESLKNRKTIAFNDDAEVNNQIRDLMMSLSTREINFKYQEVRAKETTVQTFSRKVLKNQSREPFLAGGKCTWITPVLSQTGHLTYLYQYEGRRADAGSTSPVAWWMGGGSARGARIWPLCQILTPVARPCGPDQDCWGSSD